MEFVFGKLKDLWIIEPRVFADNRGFFMETWSKREFEEHGLFYDFVQDNHSSSTVTGTLRGIHFQRGEKAQAKLVRCVRGAVYLLQDQEQPHRSMSLNEHPRKRPLLRL